MALPQLALAAGSAAARYAPAVVDAASSMLKKATGGKLTSITDIPKYVGNNSARMQVVADSLVRSGFSVDDVFPEGITSSKPELRLMREAATRLAATMKSQFDAGADKVVTPQSADEAVADVVRIKRVKAVLSIYGSAEKYFLCHPNGGVPSSDFAYYEAIRKSV